jgi:hypothetical protein
MSRSGLMLILAGSLVLGGAGCSAAGASAPPDSQPASVPAATEGAPASAMPAATPVESTAQPMPGSSESSNWAAFKDRVMAYTAMSPQISDLLGKWAAGDTTAAKQIASVLKPASEELVAWLEANPPDACYRASWEPLREGADLVAAGASAYLADDATTGSEMLMAGGSKLVDAGSTISESGDRCRGTAG